MHLDKIFELIRKEQVVLWVGSGFSLYAGYPSGKQLSQIIYDSLTISEKEEVSNNLPLTEMAEQYIRLKLDSKNSLNNLLKQIFSKKPLSLKWHLALADIPHIKTIITTNYDHLFEDAYKDEAVKIVSISDIAYRDNRVEIFKAHGDIDDPTSLVITRSDYTRFFSKENSDNLFWSAIKGILANKVIVFIGYDYEDENIKFILDKLSLELGLNQKEKFLIAPEFKEYKVAYLAQQKIQYVNFKGEIFIERLLRNIKENIINDFKSGSVNSETLVKFLSKNKMWVQLKSIEDKYHIQQIGSSENKKGNIKFKFKNDETFVNQFSEFVKGKKFGKLEIENDVLEDLKFEINEINIIGGNIKDYKLILESKPFTTGQVDIVFEDGSEFSDVSYKAFGSKVLIEVIANYKNAELKFQFNPNTYNYEGKFNFTIHGNFEKPSDGISVLTFGKYLLMGLSFTIFFKNLNPQKAHRTRLGKANFDLENLESNLSHFENLKKIEKIYQIYFRDIKDISKEDFDNAQIVLEFANGQSKLQEWDKELDFDLSKDANIDKLLEAGSIFRAEGTEKEIFKIHDQNICLGYQVIEFLDIYIVNADEVRQRSTSIIKVKSKINKIRVSFIEKHIFEK